jgi:hypothetical protein
MRVSVLALAAAVALLWGTVAAVAAADQNVNTAGETAATASAQHPTAVLPELSYEFEAVVDGTEISHDFSVKNTGDGVLAIQQVKTG